ncbi:hypothetical protein GCM10010493_30990 [Streptomyces lavendulae subsp. grasserius]
MDQTVFESIRYSAGCHDCGAELECWGVQALVHTPLREVLAGAHSGTMPEMEFLARKLRESGVDAVAARPWKP